MANAMRKRVNLKYLVDQANHMLAGPNGSPEHRTGVIVMIELALMEADHYQGFRYLNQHEVSVGLPGIRVNGNGSEVGYENDQARDDDTDRTRRAYLYSDKK